MTDICHHPKELENYPRPKARSTNSRPPNRAGIILFFQDADLSSEFSPNYRPDSREQHEVDSIANAILVAGMSTQSSSPDKRYLCDHDTTS